MQQCKYQSPWLTYLFLFPVIPFCKPLHFYNFLPQMNTSCYVKYLLTDCKTKNSGWSEVSDRVKFYSAWSSQTTNISNIKTRNNVFAAVLLFELNLFQIFGRKNYIFLEVRRLVWPRRESSKQKRMHLFLAICNLVFKVLLTRGYHDVHP